MEVAEAAVSRETHLRRNDPSDAFAADIYRITAAVSRETPLFYF
jgi:hypothetical protein